MNSNYRQQIVQMLQGMPQRAPITKPGPMPPKPPMQQKQPMPPMQPPAKKVY